MKVVKSLEASLVSFDSIMRRALVGRSYHEFSRLTAIDDFIDGFQLHQGHCSDPKSLRALLKSHHLECLPLKRKGDSGYYFG